MRNQRHAVGGCGVGDADHFHGGGAHAAENFRCNGSAESAAKPHAGRRSNVVSQNERDTPMRMQNILRHRLSKQIFYSGDSALNYQTALMTIDLLNRSGASVGIVTR